MTTIVWLYWHCILDCNKYWAWLVTKKGLCLFSFTIPGNWCIKCQTWSQIITGKGWHKLWSWSSARQCNTLPNCFFHQNPMSAEQSYSSIEWKAFGTLHGLETFHYYCFAREVCIITDYMPLVAVLSKDVATLSHWLQWTMLGIHHYRVHIIFKPGLDLYITNWLYHNSHAENKDQEITERNVTVSAINISINMPVYTSIEDLKMPTYRSWDLT